MTHYLLMTPTDLHTKSIMDSLLAGRILEHEAAEMLALSIRQVQRIKKRIREEWDEGIIHRLRGRISNHHHDPTKYDQAMRIIQEQYHDYSYVMLHEKLRDHHQILISMPTLRNELIQRGLRTVKKQKKTDIQRTMRERKACFWEMNQYDGSYHLWFENRAPEACLLVNVDDATNDLFARFDDSEGLWPTYRFWREYITDARYGKPKSIYLDRFSTYKINHPNATDDHELTTQFGRVCKELWIELIFARSPQGKGRVERMNETLQDRLVKELREAGIPHTTDRKEAIKEANTFLRDIFLPKFNAQFRVEPRSSSNLYTPLRDDERERLDTLFSEQKPRKVQNDFTIRFEGKIYQLYRNKEGWSLVYHGDTVMVERRMDMSIHMQGKAWPQSKDWKYLISKQLDALPSKSQKLPLPPLISEDPYTTKQEYMDQLQQVTREKQKREKQKREKDRNTLSLLRQQFYRVHDRTTIFDPDWIPIPT